MAVIAKTQLKPMWEREDEMKEEQGDGWRQD